MQTRHAGRAHRSGPITLREASPRSSYWMPIEGDQTLPLRRNSAHAGALPGRQSDCNAPQQVRARPRATPSSSPAFPQHCSRAIDPGGQSIPHLPLASSVARRFAREGAHNEREDPERFFTPRSAGTRLAEGKLLEEERLSASRFGVYRLGGAPSSTCCCWAAHPGGTSQDRRLFAVQETPL